MIETVLIALVSVFAYNKVIRIYTILKDHKDHYKIQYGITKLKYNNLYTKFYCTECRVKYWFDIENKKRFRF